MFILLDIDGVMVPAASWKRPAILDDGFPEFDIKAVSSLNRILVETKASIVLTTSHKSTYAIDEWENIFRKRNINTSIQKIDDNTDNLNRKEEILNWLDKNSREENYVIIDDDKILNGLPSEIKEKLVLTKSLIGLSQDDATNAIEVLMTSSLTLI